jgi:hypothetical protein
MADQGRNGEKCGSRAIILARVLRLLCDEGILEPSRKSPVVRFQHPDKLQVSFTLNIAVWSVGPCSAEDHSWMVDIPVSRSYVQYQAREHWQVFVVDLSNYIESTLKQATTVLSKIAVTYSQSTYDMWICYDI